jgi:hypothetical protein
MGETSNGHKKWGEWFFDYGVFGVEGLCLVDGYFRGQRMFNKLSLPVIRVKYLIDEQWLGVTSLPLPGLGIACGPYNDQIEWDPEDFGENLNPISGPHHLVEFKTPDGGRYILIQEMLLGGVPHLTLAVYARIGAYHIVQEWTLNNDGLVMPRIFSKGLSCNLDHWHHPYWRLDFALGRPEMQRVAVFHKHGSKIADITNESALINSVFSPSPEYAITSTQRPDVGHIEYPAQAIVMPPQIDLEGVVGPTDFAPFDGYVRKYRPEEDRSWPHLPPDDIRFAVHEPCVDSDIVFWSICHLQHHANEGKDHWHGVGPDIRFRPMLLAALPPECMRVIDVKGQLDVKNFKLVGKDQWKHMPFSEQLLVNPNAPNGEVVQILGAGDVTAELIIRVTWNRDCSVNIHFFANLLDEAQRVARVENQFNVLRNGSGQWSGIHLVDYHGGDPDTADMAFDVQNSQQ